MLVFPVDLANMMHEGAAFVASDRGGEVGTAWRKERPGALNSARLNRHRGECTRRGFTGTGGVSTSHDGDECTIEPHICVTRCDWWWVAVEKANGSADVGSFQLGELLRVSQ